MIPTTTYDQVRLEQHNQLAHLERRRHAHSVGSAYIHFTERVRPQTSGWRAAVAVGAILITSLVLFLF